MNRKNAANIHLFFPSYNAHCLLTQRLNCWIRILIETADLQHCFYQYHLETARPQVALCLLFCRDYHYSCIIYFVR
jgi:hypothetical protein